jgi:hypothetical protein
MLVTALDESRLTVRVTLAPGLTSEFHLGLPGKTLPLRAANKWQQTKNLRRNGTGWLGTVPLHRQPLRRPQ